MRGWAFGYYYKTCQEVIEKGWDETTTPIPIMVYNKVNGGVDEEPRVWYL
jgi:hypothetical protein